MDARTGLGRFRELRISNDPRRPGDAPHRRLPDPLGRGDPGAARWEGARRSRLRARDEIP